MARDAVMAALAEARAEASALREAARAEGFAAGRDEALAAVAPALDALEAAVGAVHAERLDAAVRLESHAVDLALLLAEKVIAAAVSRRSFARGRGGARCAAQPRRAGAGHRAVHPDDLEIVRSAMVELRGSLGGIEHCEVQAERRVSRGGAIVRTPDGDVDAADRDQARRPARSSRRMSRALIAPPAGTT